MTTMTADSRQVADYSHVKRPPPSFNNIAAWLVLVSLLVGGVWSLKQLGVSLRAVASSLDNASRFLERMFPLDFPPALELASLLAETLAIVFLSTLLAVVLSVPTAFFAARPTSSGPVLYWTSRAAIVLARAVPDLVLAIVFLRLFGIGPIAGILAMGVHSVGMVGKLYADAIEELDQGPSEAIRTAGGTRMQQIHASTLIQLVPQMIATALHRFDINLRTSVLLGYVGVGGIGHAISNSLSTLNYQRGMALALVILVLCIAVELTSAAMRAAIMRGNQPGRKHWSDRAIDQIRSRRRHVSDIPGDTATAQGKEQLLPPWDADRVNRFVGLSTLVVLTVASLWQVEIRWGQLFQGFANIPKTLGLFWPPDTSNAVLESVYEGMLVTIQIALGATLLGLVIALPIGIFAASNVVTNRYVQRTFRILIVVIRGIPELILAIVFVVISGLGGIAGTLALAVGAVGLFSKLLADSLEETDRGPQEAIAATGATGPQVFFSATLRQTLPALIAHLMYLFDSNIRSATLLGVVGAGGVGFLLMNASRVNQFPVVTTILLAMVAVVLAVEAVSVWLRKSFR